MRPEWLETHNFTITESTIITSLVSPATNMIPRLLPKLGPPNHPTEQERQILFIDCYRLNVCISSKIHM